MPQENERAVQKVVLPGQSPEGRHILSVLLKRSYDIVLGGRCTRALSDQKLLAGDVYYGDPMNSTVKYESDFVPFKPATDVVFIGNAYAPKGKPARILRAALSVGKFHKEVLVFGNRVCRYTRGFALEFSGPAPFETMAMRYENAYGGADVYSDPKMPALYPRNHLGRGFVVEKNKKSFENFVLPNIEDPQHLLTPENLCAGKMKHWEQQPMPQGFGWFSKFWQPRAALAGVMPADRLLEQELRKAYSAAVPKEQRELYEQTKLPDMDFRFFNGASQGLAVPFLSGEEEIRATNLSPEGEISFQLPGERPVIALDIGMGAQELAAALHTVMIRMEERQVDLVWRAASPYPGPDWMPDMKKMEVIIP